MKYYCKLPDPIDQRLIVALDPMLATRWFCNCCRRFHQAAWRKTDQIHVHHRGSGRTQTSPGSSPDIQIYVGHLDRQLNEDALYLSGTWRRRRPYFRYPVVSGIVSFINTLFHLHLYDFLYLYGFICICTILFILFVFFSNTFLTFNRTGLCNSFINRQMR